MKYAGPALLALTTALPFALAVACGGNEPAPQTPTTTSVTATSDSASATTPATGATVSATPATTAAAPDLSTEDKARTAIYEALKRDDKEGFKKLVSKRILTKIGTEFDTWYAVWKAASDKGATAFARVHVTKEDGGFKLDEQ